jgi:hypothetical protein
MFTAAYGEPFAEILFIERRYSGTLAAGGEALEE